MNKSNNRLAIINSIYINIYLKIWSLLHAISKICFKALKDQVIPPTCKSVYPLAFISVGRNINPTKFEAQNKNKSIFSQ